MTENTGQTGSGGANAPVTPDSLERAIGNISVSFAKFRNVQNASRRQMLVVLVLILVVFLVFLAATYKTLNKNFTEKAVRTAVTKRAEILRKPVLDELDQIVTKVLPVYQEEVGKSLARIAPQLQAQAMIQADNFSASLEKKLSERLEKSLQTGFTALRSDLKLQFPTLADERKFDKLTAELDKRLQDENEKLGNRMMSIYETERDKIEKILVKFEAPTDKEAVDLEFDLLHYLLLLGDLHLQEMRAPKK